MPIHIPFTSALSLYVIHKISIHFMYGKKFYKVQLE